MATSQGDSSGAAELPFSAAPARLIVDARHEAARLKHAHVGTEHLMLALSQQSGVAAQLLANLGVTLARAESYAREAANEV